MTRQVAAAIAMLASACGAGVEPIALGEPIEQWREPVTAMSFVRIPSGRFVMGSPSTEAGREEQERQHEVVLSRPFYLGRFEVTQGQWTAVVGGNPSWFPAGEGMPVENVTWHEVRQFLDRLTALSADSRFRLPSEAEWEFACRAGTATAYPVGDALTTSQANVDGRGLAVERPDTAFRGRPTAGGSFPPNAWGLHDMNGNLWEWTADEHCPYGDAPVVDPVGQCGSPLKVIRGGSWYFGADSARCALRYTHDPGDRGFSLGFRVVREDR